MNSFVSRKTFRVVCMIFQIALLAIGIALLCVYGVEGMSFTAVVSISFDFLAMLMMVMIIRSCFNVRMIRSSNIFLKLLMMTYVCVFFECVGWIVDKDPRAIAVNYISNIGSNCAVLLSIYLFFEYVNISCKIKKSKWQKILVMTTTVVGIALEILNISTPIFYLIGEDGVYVRNPKTGFLGFVPVLIVMTVCCINIFRASVNISVKLTYLSFAFIPFVVSIWYTFTGFPPTFFVALFFSLMLIYCNIYIVQSREMERMELESTRQNAIIEKQRNQMALSQIRPHFLYNALGSIEVLCKSDPAKAGEAVHFFSRYLRSNMDALGDVEMISFSKELDHIHNYIWLEKMRFDEDLEFEENIEVTDFLIPTLAVQPLVENAVKHGMMGKEEGVLNVRLSTALKEEAIEIVVEDDGAGFDMKAPKEDAPGEERSHLGLTNVRERIRTLTGGEASVESEIGKGTKIVIRLPKQ